MAIHDNLDTFAGRSVVDFEAGASLPDPATTAVRIGIVYDGPVDYFPEAWAQFINTDGVQQTQALVIGNWASEEDGTAPSHAAVTVMTASAGRLPNLKALFFGDITSEQNEISWIEQSDVSGFWKAFPNLEEVGIRGTNNLTLGRISHRKLRKLAIQTGGLPRSVLAACIEADTPELEHFEVWFGTDNYGGDCTPANLARLLDGSRFPKLATLALRNCEWADELAAVVARAPILARVKALDLSMGTLSDAGVERLIASPHVRKLQAIDISHHYASDLAVDRLRALGVPVTAANRQTPEEFDGEEHRFVAVSE